MLFDRPLHPLKGSGTIFFVKCIPGQVNGQGGGVGEDSSPNDEITGTMKFEKEGVTRAQCSKYCFPT